MAGRRKAIRFQMFGRFSVFYGGRELKLDKSGTTNTMQLLALLIYFRGGISREALLRALYGDKDLADRNNNLRVTAFKLRKLLIQAGLPEDNYITVHNDVYKWTAKTPIECDVWEFRKCISAAAAAKTEEDELAYRRKACALYGDEFLRPIAYEDWVVMEAVPLKREYVTCLQRLCEMLNSIGAYQELTAVCAAAENIYPYDEWQMIRIDALMALNRYEEALTAYQEFTDMRFDELGLSPTQEMLECYRKISEAMDTRSRSADEIYLGLLEREEDENAGAVYVTYSSFMDRFRFLQRISERSGESNYLVVVNMSHRSGKPMDSIRTDGKEDEVIRRIFSSSLRRTDTFTKYNASQYLLLLVGIDLESIRIVTGRINEMLLKETRNWKLTCRCRALSPGRSGTDEAEVSWDFSKNGSEGNAL